MKCHPAFVIKNLMLTWTYVIAIVEAYIESVVMKYISMYYKHIDIGQMYTVTSIGTQEAIPNT